jgi:hypothetical protein
VTPKEGKEGGREGGRWEGRGVRREDGGGKGRSIGQKMKRK